MRSLDDTMKKTWMKILGIYILHLLFSFQNYSFLYVNEKVAGIWAWIDPKYLVEFLVIGVVGCVFLCRQRVKEFSSNIFNRESIILLLINVVFILFVIITKSFSDSAKTVSTSHDALLLPAIIVEKFLSISHNFLALLMITSLLPPSVPPQSSTKSRSIA